LILEVVAMAGMVNKHQRRCARSAGGSVVARRRFSRELRRHASTRSDELAYRATTAQWHAERRAKRPKAQAADRLNADGVLSNRGM
jgi:hypothetical protein